MKCTFRWYLIAGGVLIALATNIWPQYEGGDFVNQNENDLAARYQVDTEEELIEDLQSVLNLIQVGVFPRRKTNCLKYREVRTTTYKALKIMKKVVPVLPKNYRIVVIGNADKRGRAKSTKKRRGNDYWSAMRAKCVADFIVKEYPKSKQYILMGGQGSTINKRVVTFKILPAKQALQLHEGLVRKFKWD